MKFSCGTFISVQTLYETLGLEAWLLQIAIIHVLARRCHNHPAVLSPPFLTPGPLNSV